MISERLRGLEAILKNVLNANSNIILLMTILLRWYPLLTVVTQFCNLKKMYVIKSTTPSWMILLSRQTLTRKKFSTIKFHAYSMRVIFLLASLRMTYSKRQFYSQPCLYTSYKEEHSLRPSWQDIYWSNHHGCFSSGRQGSYSNTRWLEWHTQFPCNCPLCAYWRLIILSEFCWHWIKQKKLLPTVLT